MTQVLKTPISFSSNLPKTGATTSTNAASARSIKLYEAKPPSNLPSELIDAENVLATTKEEEWVTKKKTELTTKKQIETRVKRQVVLEDGKVVEDSGPIVTTNTTEDTEKQEHQQTEHRKVGDDEPSASDGWIAVPDSAATGLVSKQVKENKLRSREETEERLETEHVQHLGDITDDAFLKAIQSQRNDLRLALRQASSELLNTSSTMPTPALSNGRVVHHSLKNRKTVDTEDTKHLSQVQNDGRLITETTTTTEHEEVKNTAEPDDDDDGGGQNNALADEDYETHEKSSQRYRKSKEQELIEYVADGVKMGQQVRYEAENVEGDRHGNADGLKMQPLEWESLSERVRRMHKEKQLKLQEAERMDALTRKPLNVDQEEQTRKTETSKWLEHHFGSESRSSKSSLDSDNEDEKDDGGGGGGRRAKRSTSFINVTMKSTKPARIQSQSPTASVPATSTNSYKRVSNIGNDVKSTSSATKNVYEIQTGSVKKIQADERPFLPSLFRPIDEQRQTKTPPPPMTTFYTAQSSSSPTGVSAYNSKSESHPLYASVQRKYPSSSSSSSSIATAKANKLSTTKNFGHSQTRLASSQSDKRKNFEPTIQIETNRSRNQNRESEKKLTSAGRDTSKSILSNSWSRSERHLADIDNSRVHNEPDPDYTPRLRKKVLSTPDMRASSPPPPPPIDGTKKKIYQKTRFAAEMPLVKRSKSTSRPERKSISGGGGGGTGSGGTSGGFGQTFRKIISRFHNKEGVEKKGKKWRNESSSSSPPPSISKNHDDDGGGGGGYYQTFGNVDNHIADTSGSNANSNVGEMENGGRESPLPKQAAKHFSSEQLNNANVVSKKRVTTPSPSPSPFFRRSSALTSANANANPNPNASSSLWYSQTLDRNYRSNSSKNINANTNTNRDKQLDEMFKRRSPVQKYYLGEDPYTGSIYGREKEYDAAAAKPFRRKQHKNSNGNGNANGQEKKSVKSHILNGMHNIFGGRLGKSTSKLGSDSNQKSTNKKSQYIDYTNRGGIQTLPRKSKKQVFINDPSSDQENLHSRRSLNRNASSLINVSVINDGGGGRAASTFKLSPDIVGPEKPARTYRTSLLRSKSFNVQLGPYGYERSRSPVLAFKSNPQLHKLEESQAPLKSPGIVTSISRSTRDLSKSVDDHDHDHDRHHHHYFEQRTAAKDYSKINGFSSSPSPSSYDNSSSRRLFLKGLKSRAPELYKTLHEDDEFDSPLPSSHTHTTSSMIRNGGGIGRPKQRLLEYSNSFHSGTLPSSRKPTVSFESDRQHSPVTASRSLVTSAVDSNNSDDYNETVRITSKSNDPIRPSVTNTVQSFSKKTIPSKDGRLETIESSETTRVTKSHYRSGDSDTEKNATTSTSSSSRYNTKNGKNTKNGSVVIEVRNDRN